MGVTVLITELVILKAGKSCLKSFTAERRLGRVYVQVGIVSSVQLESLKGILRVLQELHKDSQFHNWSSRQ